MFKYIENLRKKPEPERKRAVLWLSVWVTLFIAIVWGVFMAMRVSTTDFSLKPDPVENDAPNLTDTFTNFMNIVDQQTQGTGGSDSSAPAAAATDTTQNTLPPELAQPASQ